MRLVRFRLDNDDPSYGVINDESISRIYGDIDNLQVGEHVSGLNDVELLEPCRPSKIVAVARNFSGIGESYSEDFEPIFFIKSGNAICAPGTEVVNPFPELAMWGEPELAVVIKKKLRNATTSEVTNGILGFTIANDFTVENTNGRDHHLARSKCPDNFCPLGPWIETDYDSSDCLIEGLQNGIVVRSGRSSEQIWQWPQIIQRLSSWITLEPWDIVLTGNPPDIHGGMVTSSEGMVYIGAGDQYIARISGLGELENKVVSIDRGSNPQGVD